ncbi:MAG: DUF3857 domain-containing protein [Terriglobia bacterium]
MSTSKAAEATPPAIFEKLEVDYRFDNSGIGTETRRAVIKINSNEGLASHQKVIVPYMAENQAAEIHRVRTIKSTGQTIDASLDSALEIPAPVGPLSSVFSDEKIKMIPAAGLQIGDSLELEYAIKTNKPLKPGDFWQTHFLDRMVPVLEGRVFLTVPSQRKTSLAMDEKIKHSASVSEQDGTTTHVWEWSNPKPESAENFVKSLLAMEFPEPLFTVSTFQDWETLGKWIEALFEDRMTSTPELQEVARKLAEGKQTDREKVEALYHLVSQSIHYLGISMGIGGIQPHPASEVWKKQFGDCKDKHAVFGALLSSIGIPCYTALVCTLDNVPLDVPSPDRFNHVVSIVPLDGKLVWLDTTAPFGVFGAIAPELRGKSSLALIPGSFKPITIPTSSEVEDRRSLTASGEINDRGEWNLKITNLRQGWFERDARNYYFDSDKKNKDNIFYGDLISRSDKSKEELIHRSDPMDFNSPFQSEISMALTKLIDPLKRVNSIELPSMLARALPWSLPAKDAKSKEKEIRLGGPMTLEESVEIKTAPNYRIFPPTGSKEVREFGAFESSYQVVNGTLVYRRKLHLNQFNIPMEQKENLESFSNHIRKELDQEISFERTTPVDYIEIANRLSADELNRAGYDLQTKGKYFIASKFYRKSTEKNPKGAYAWNNLGQMLSRFGDLEEARLAYEKQISVEPKDAYSYTNLGRLYVRKGMYDKAIPFFQKQLEINPADTRSHESLADAFAKSKKWDQARTEFEKASALTPNNTFLKLFIGETYLCLGDHDQWKSYLETAIEGNSGPSLFNAAAYMLAECGGNLDEAQRYAESAVHNAESFMLMQSTMKGWKPAVSAQGSLSSFLDTLGWVYFRKGDYTKAGTYLEAAAVLLWNPEVYGHLIRLYSKINNPQKAEEAHRFVSQIDPDYPLELPPEFKPPSNAGRKNPNSPGQVFEPEYWQEIGKEEHFSWPSSALTTVEQRQLILCLVDANGKVLDVTALGGEDPWKAAAMTEALKLRLPPVAWNNQPIKTFRPVIFIYHPDKKVTVLYSMCSDAFARLYAKDQEVETFKGY